MRDANETIAVRPDSQAAYVLNRQTGDVTIVDAASGSTVEKIGTDGFAVHFLTGASTALVVDNSAVHAIDMTTNKKLDDLASGKFDGEGFSRIELSPDGKYAVVYGRQAVVCVNGSSGKASGHLRMFGMSLTSSSTGVLGRESFHVAAAITPCDNVARCDSVCDPVVSTCR